MIHDGQNLFSSEQSVTASAASTNLIDLGIERYIGTGQPIYVVVVCDAAMTDGGSDSTVTVTLQSDAASAFGSPTTVQTLGTFAATAAAGTRLLGVIPPDVATERYIRLYYTVANGNLTTGDFTAFLALDAQTFRSYADAITIS